MTAFVYGTLMFPEVLRALIDRVPRMEPAVVRGYQRHRVRGQVFPGAVRSVAGASVAGLVLLDLQPDELEMFDEFEGDEYRKEACEAELAGGGRCATSLYVWQDALRGQLYGEWDPEQFRQCQLAAYVDMCARFAADVRSQLAWERGVASGASSEEGSAAAGQRGGDGQGGGEGQAGGDR